MGATNPYRAGFVRRYSLRIGMGSQPWRVELRKEPRRFEGGKKVAPALPVLLETTPSERGRWVVAKSVVVSTWPLSCHKKGRVQGVSRDGPRTFQHVAQDSHFRSCGFSIRKGRRAATSKGGSCATKLPGTGRLSPLSPLSFSRTLFCFRYNATRWVG